MVADDASFGSGDAKHRRGTESRTWAVWVLVVVQAGAVIVQVVAVSMAWRGASSSGNVVSCTGLGLTFASALWALSAPRLGRALRNTAVVGLGITTAVQWRMNDPLLFRGYDEQLHMRTLRDIEASHSLFQPNPILAVSSRYPALESFAAFLHQFGLPEMVAATAVILLARLALVLALCAAVEHLTGSVRAGGLAVAVYAISPQFVFFNSQFAYQTLALPLALAAVAFVARARWAHNPAPLLVGATVCLLAVAVTHHLTSWITAVFLLVWGISERHARARRYVFCGAAVAVLAGAIWAAIQWTLLRDYFGPMVDDVTTQLHGTGHRALFTETSRDAKPLWQRALLIYYAIAVTLTVMSLVLIHVKPIIRRVRPTSARLAGRHQGVGPVDGNEFRWGPGALLLSIVAVIPLLFGVRVLPSFGEIGDRANSFVFLPLSLLVAAAMVRFGFGGQAHESRSVSGKVRMRARLAPLYRPVGVLLAAGVFLGGYVLGSGSDWARLPGGYLPGADGRSMDAEMLVSMQWAHDSLPAGSRMGADRVSSTLLASEAGAWPVMAIVGPSLYQVPYWGSDQTAIVRELRLRYLFVDRRFAGERPYVDGYFDEKSPPLTLTHTGLTKFDDVPGIREVYRHGPISIYDLGGLGISELQSGWAGHTPRPDLSMQVLFGLLAGGAFSLIVRMRLGHRVIRAVRSIVSNAGPALAYVLGLAVLCIMSIVLILAHIWFTPAFFFSVVSIAVIANPRRTGHLLRNLATRFRWRWFAPTGAVALGVAAAITVAALEASSAHHLTAEEKAVCANTNCDATR